MKAKNVILLAVGGYLAYRFIYQPHKENKTLQKAAEEQDVAIDEFSNASIFNDAAIMMPNQPTGYFNHASNCPSQGNKCDIWLPDGTYVLGAINNNCDCVPLEQVYATRGSRSII